MNNGTERPEENTAVHIRDVSNGNPVAFWLKTAGTIVLAGTGILFSSYLTGIPLFPLNRITASFMIFAMFVGPSFGAVLLLSPWATKGSHRGYVVALLALVLMVVSLFTIIWNIRLP